MAIADDFSIDYVNKRITYTGTFSGGIAPTRYTVNELYSYLQDTFDEPAQMDDPVPMSAQTPTQYTLINLWFMDDETVKALYSGSIQTTGWTYSASAQTGITQVHWTTGSADPPVAGDIGVTLTDGTSGATGVLLAVDTGRRVAFIRNNNGSQFAAGNTVTGTGVSLVIEADNGAQQGVRSGETVWTNAYSVGTIQAETEIYIAQETETHGGDPVPVLAKLTSWWDTDTDFTASANGVSAGNIDILIKVRDAGVWVDDLGAGSSGRIAAYARQGGTVYSHFEFLGGVGNFVIPFASTGYDINVDAFHRVSINETHNTFATNENIVGETSGASAVLKTYVLDTNVDYILVGKDLTDIQNGEVIIGQGSTPVPSAVISSVPSDINGAAVAGVTVTFGHAVADVDQDGTNENYACTVNCNSNSLDNVYQYLMYLTRRGSVADLLPDASGGYEDAEFYRGIGDLYATYTTETAALTEGVTVSGVTSAAEGIVTSYESGGNGDLVLTNVKGTFQASEVVKDSTTGNITLSTTTPESIVDVNAAPFGTFAGGRFFVARGVLLTNVPAADNNNWQTSDVTGTAYQPPTTITLTLAGLTANDRGVVLEVATDGGTDVVKTAVGLQLGNAVRGAVGTSGVYLDATVQQDVPLVGWIRVVDTSDAANGTEYRYEFSNISGSGVTFRPVNADSGAGTGAATATHATNSGVILESTGIGFPGFGYTNGRVKTGHHIRNISDGSNAVVLRAVNADQIETTPLAGGTNNYWKNTDVYQVNGVVAAIAEDDTCYFPFIDDVCPSGGATSLSKSLKYAADTTVLARARFSDPDVGGTRILPFELLGQSITNADLTITAIRTTDSIAS
jgi:hypothetical protein